MTDIKKTISTFSDPRAISEYAEKTAKLVPALSDLHRMTGILLAEKMPETGCVLVLGAGGGLELKALTQTYPNWHFDGVDPSAEMIDLAKMTLGGLCSHVDFYEGYIDHAPDRLYDGAVCLLTLHFLEKNERQRTVNEIFRRLKPGGTFVLAHHSFPTAASDKDKWLGRFAAASGGHFPQSNIAAIKEHLPVLSPIEDEAILRNSGFVDIELFYAAFTFKGWVCHKPNQVRNNKL